MPKTALNDEENVHMVLVEDQDGFSVEDAYRLLAEQPLEPVTVQEEE